MWELAAATVAILFALVPGQVGGQIHFDRTTGDCGANSTLVGQCNALYQREVLLNQFLESWTQELDCQLMVDTIACLETALCHCNFSADHPQLEYGYRSSMILYHYFNNLTQCANQTWRTGIQADVVGPIDDVEGVNCTKYNRTAGDLGLVLAVSQQEAVLEVEQMCAGVQECYMQYDTDLARALYQGDWPQFCEEIAQLISCLVNMTCACGHSAHENVVTMVSTERRIYRDSCGAIVDFGTITEIGITCPGADLCDSPDPMYNCLKEFERTLDLAQNLGEQCTGLYNLANCTEDLACQCGFYQQPTYYRSLAISKYNYEKQSNCEPVSGKFPNHTGLNCGDDTQFTESEKVLSIALAEPTFVAAEEATCPGIRDCYEVANAKSSLAHMQKDLTSICYTDAERISCLEKAYCDCGRLNQPVVYTRLFQERKVLADLCSGVANAPELTRCRGASTCQITDPLVVCADEYRYDTVMAKEDFALQCQATKNYITCSEEVGCACGMLSDATSAEAEAVYNISTLSLKIYNDFDCPRFAGSFLPDDLGIKCKGIPNDNMRKKLILTYAESDEVAALALKCGKVKKCFQVSDQAKSEALVKRNVVQLCQAQQKLVLCVEGEYCQCHLNATAQAEDYITTEIRSHESVCDNLFPISRNTCKVKPTGAADSVRFTSLGFILTLLVTLVVMS